MYAFRTTHSHTKVYVHVLKFSDHFIQMDQEAQKSPKKTHPLVPTPMSAHDQWRQEGQGQLQVEDTGKHQKQKRVWEKEQTLPKQHHNKRAKHTSPNKKKVIYYINIHDEMKIFMQ